MTSADFFKNNVSVKRFSQNPVDEEKIKALSSAIKNCSSMDNRQPWKVVLVRDEQAKKNISAACYGNKSLIEAPLILVVCGLPDDAYPTLGGFLNSYSVDAGVLMERISLSAKSLGMHTEWSYSFKEEKVREIVQAPGESRVISVSPLGLAVETSNLPPARPVQELVSYDHY